MKDEIKEKCSDCKYSRQCVTVKQIDPECCLKDRNSEKKNEIKEILDFKEDADYKKLSVDEIAILEDYITNLQKSQETLIKNDNEIITNLQERFDALLEAHKICDELEQEKQQRIDKSIEYIKDFWKKKSYYEDIDNCMKYATMNEFDKEDLLNILEGSDKK